MRLEGGPVSPFRLHPGCHTGEGRYPPQPWVPAFAGTTHEAGSPLSERKRYGPQNEDRISRGTTPGLRGELDRLHHGNLEPGPLRSDLDAGQLQQHLGQCGFADLVGALMAQIAAHAGFASRGGDDPEVIRRGLKEAFQFLRMRNAGDHADAERALAADTSDETWERLQALKERDAQEGPIGGLYC
jgi:hypothetical protein